LSEAVTVGVLKVTLHALSGFIDEIPYASIETFLYVPISIFNLEQERVTEKKLIIVKGACL